MELKYSPEQLQILKASMPDLDEQDFAFLVEVSRTSGLNLFQRQIYGIKRKGRLTIQTGIDGYRLVAARTGQHAGTSDVVFQVEDSRYPTAATVTVSKLLPNGAIGQFTATARWGEYAQQNSPMWGRMPFLMLGKCAEALALRKAFPGELAGIYTSEEMMQADEAPQVGQQAQQLAALVEARQEQQEAPKEQQEAPKKQKPVQAPQGPQEGQQEATKVELEPISPQQLKLIAVLWREIFGDPKDELAARAIREHMVYVTQKESRKDLSKAEAGKLIESLQDMKEGK